MSNTNAAPVVNQDLADECSLAWAFQSDVTFLTETSTLLADAVGPWAQVKNMRNLRDDAKIRLLYLEALSAEMQEAREEGETEILPPLARRKALLREAHAKLWAEKTQPPISPRIMDQLDGEE